MILKEIEFNNFRNLSTERISFSNKINIFVGDNGQGKTNLLESIYLLSIAKSFKTNKLVNVAKYNCSSFFVKGLIEKNNYNYKIDFVYENNKKNISINKNSLSKYKDIIGKLNAILFVPEDLNLLKGSPVLRRRLIDIELSKVSAKYLDSLSKYQHLLKQRNMLLKNDTTDLVYLESLDALLAQYGACIHKFRVDFIKALKPFFSKAYQQISGRDQVVDIVLKSNVNDDKDDYFKILSDNRKKDLTFKVTNIGIHRDDFQVLLDKKDASTFASQGEQRTLVLAIKLALVEYIKDVSNDYPILLLDDVLSELDDKRIDNLILFINKNIQTFITTTSIDSIKDSLLDNAKIFYIDNGLIKEA